MGETAALGISAILLEAVEWAPELLLKIGQPRYPNISTRTGSFAPHSFERFAFFQRFMCPVIYRNLIEKTLEQLVGAFGENKPFGSSVESKTGAVALADGE